MIKISVVIPLYNQSEYIDEAVESVYMSGYEHEIIVINDGSTDGFKNLDKWPRVRLINQVNKGLSSARNTGIMNATGDYILFLDADDILLDKCLWRIEEVIRETGADIVAPSFKEFGLRNTEIILMDNPTIEDFKTGNRIGYCSAIRTSLLKEVGGYSPRMTFGYEDYALWFDLLKRGATIKTIPEVLWLYRTKEKSMIHDAMAHHNELVAQINKDFNVGLPEIKTPLPC